MFFDRWGHNKMWNIALALGVFCLSMSALFAQGGVPQVQSEIQHTGDAEFRAITGGGFDPDHQPAVYWHDSDWRIDLITPTPQQGGGTIKIQPANGPSKTALLPEIVAQIDSITRGPNDKSIVITDVSGSGLSSFGIIDLNTGKLVDSALVYKPVQSLNGRFIIYINGFSPHSPFPTEDHYRLYDLLKTPVENTCGYRDNDPKHKSLDDSWRGQPVYPLRRNEIFRPSEDPDAPAGSLHKIVGSFVWSPDSSKVLFADSQGEVVSLILVFAPKGPRDSPATLVYRLPNPSETSARKQNWEELKSVEWNGDTIEATLQSALLRGRRETSVVTVKESEFKPAPR